MSSREICLDGRRQRQFTILQRRNMQSNSTSRRVTPRVPPGLVPPGLMIPRGPGFPPGIPLSSGAATPRTLFPRRRCSEEHRVETYPRPVIPRRPASVLPLAPALPLATPLDSAEALPVAAHLGPTLPSVIGTPLDTVLPYGAPIPLGFTVHSASSVPVGTLSSPARALSPSLSYHNHQTVDHAPPSSTPIQELRIRSRDVDIVLDLPRRSLPGAGETALSAYIIILRDGYLLLKQNFAEYKSQNGIVDSSLPAFKSWIDDDIDKITRYFSTMQTGNVKTHRRRQEMCTSFSLEDDTEFYPNLLTTKDKEILKSSHPDSAVKKEIKDDYPPAEAEAVIAFSTGLTLHNMLSLSREEIRKRGKAVMVQAVVDLTDAYTGLEKGCKDSGMNLDTEGHEIGNPAAISVRDWEFDDVQEALSERIMGPHDPEPPSYEVFPSCWAVEGYSRRFRALDAQAAAFEPLSQGLTVEGQPPEPCQKFRDILVVPEEKGLK
ncbi:hypothetical protein OCU04_006458 [Sclerotinia nivalis]|uniref:Uncharacterized protein n=1 Tax=Sclerotinia nivalis TaxID=352851 RepID=A0A9X0AN32_9HELO|nr:hypothetical protein OCU04_006458 [Sclerotinia nivalis]